MSDDLIKKMLGDMTQNAGQGEPLPCSFGRSPFADLTMKAESGDVNAQNELGRLFRAERLYKYAFHWFLRAAKQGDVASQKAVGEMFLLCRKKTDGQGLAVSQNDELLHWAKTDTGWGQNGFPSIPESRRTRKGGFGRRV